jgi:hypothetical protein
MSLGPDFICIGAPKSGTTWLYRNLGKHPSIWLPPVKELHYFDALFPLPRYASIKYSHRGLFGLFKQHSRKRITHVFYQAMRRGSLGNMVWAYRYFSGSPGDDWYFSLFNKREGILAGDLTTDYCALSEAAVAKVKHLLPDAKIIFLMRNPVDRAWSHARMLLPVLLGRPFAEISNDELVTYLTHPAPQLRGNYPRTLELWEGIFGQQQLFVGFFEEIAERPRELYIRLLEFLGLSTDEKNIPGGLESKVNVSRATGAKQIPDDVRKCLTDVYRQDLEWLAERFGGYTTKWLADAG